jgi:hypothetical protein
MSGSNEDLHCFSTANGGVYIIRYLRNDLGGLYEADAILSAFGEYLRRLTLDDAMRFLREQDARSSTSALSRLSTTGRNWATMH